MQSNNENNMQQNGLSVTGIIFKYMLGFYPGLAEKDAVISGYSHLLALCSQNPDSEYIFATSLIEEFSRYRKALVSCMSMDIDETPSDETDYSQIVKDLDVQEYRPGILTKEEELFFADNIYDYLCQLRKIDQDIMAKVCRNVLSKPCYGKNIYIASAPFPGLFLKDFRQELKFSRDVCFHIVINEPLLRYIANTQLADFPYPYKLYANEEEIGIEKFDVIIAFDPGTKKERVDEQEILRLHGMLSEEGELIIPVHNSYLAQPHLDESANSHFAPLIKRNAIKTIVQLPEFLSQRKTGSISILEIIAGENSTPEDSRRIWLRPSQYILMVDASKLDRYDLTYKHISLDGKEIDMLIDMLDHPTEHSDYDQMLRDDEVSYESQEVVKERILDSHGILLPAYHLHYKYPVWQNLYMLFKECQSIKKNRDSVKIIRSNNLSKYATGAEFDISELETIQYNGNERVICGPAVLAKFHANGDCETCIVGKENAVAIEDGIFAFSVKDGRWYDEEKEFDIDERLTYLECLLHDIETEVSILCFDSSVYPLTEKQILYLPAKFRNSDEVAGYVSRIIGNNIKSLQQEIVKQHEEYKRQVRIRKHAMSQTVSSLSATWNVLMSYMNQRGTLGLAETIGVRHPVSVKSQIEKVAKLMTTLSTQTDHLTDIDYNWGEQISLEPTGYFLKYVSEHQNVSFKFDLSENNLVDKEDCIFMVAPDALDRVMSNIISNAQSHGFTDNSRTDYCIKIVWGRSLDSVLISIGNNGNPLLPDMKESELTDYGVSSALNTDGHSGIGCSDIKSIVEQQGGTFEIKRHDGEPFPVEYILSFPRVTK